MAVLRRFYERYGRKLGGRGLRDFGEVEQALRAKGFLPFLDRVWPRRRRRRSSRALLTQRRGSPRPPRGSSSRGAGLLLRPARGFGWSDGDLPLLDEARALARGGRRARSAT